MVNEASHVGGSRNTWWFNGISYTMYKYIMIYQIFIYIMFILVISLGIEWDITGFNGILM